MQGACRPSYVLSSAAPLGEAGRCEYPPILALGYPRGWETCVWVPEGTGEKRSLVILESHEELRDPYSNPRGNSGDLVEEAEDFFILKCLAPGILNFIGTLNNLSDSV